MPSIIQLVQQKSFLTRVNRGFTLAEVLLTLTIIGIVASLTIPDIVTSIQTTTYKSAWKTEFSAVMRATEQLISDKGSNKNLCTSGSNDCYRTLYGNYIIFIKTCVGGNAYTDGCWDPAYRVMNNDPGYWDFSGYSGAILPNGSSMLFVYRNQSCQDGPFGTENYYRCGAILFDTNGPGKGPNKFGYDLFQVEVLQDKIAPDGTFHDSHYDTCKADKMGLSCATEYLLN